MAVANGNASPKDEAEAEVQPPAYGRPSDDKDAPIRDGLYILMNKMSRTLLPPDADAVIAVFLGHSKSGTQCQGWTQYSLGNQLWIVQKTPGKDTYTLKNIQHAAFLDLLAGNPENGAPAIGHHRVEGSLNQEWRIVEHAPHYYTLQCAKTNTYLEIPGGNSENGIKTTCSNAASEMDHQLWILDRVSRSGQEIRSIIERWKPGLLSPKLFLPHGEAAEYLGLPAIHCRSLWEKTNLQRQPIQPLFFDYDLFVVKSKDTVHSWAKNTFPAETRGFSILFGIIYGEPKKGPKAYNWYLTSDMCSLVFFDPQTGKEYSAAALDELGFEPALAML